MKYAVACIVLLTTFSESAKLPPSFKICDRKLPNFSKCLPAAVQDAMTQLTQPMKELGLPSLDPLEVPSISIAAGTNAVGLAQNFKNVKIFGINHPHCTQMDVDFVKKTIDTLCSFPLIRLESEYDLNGKILLLEVYGSGLGTITLDKLNITIHSKYEELMKNGKKHFHITDDGYLKMEPERVHFHFENLFNGEKVLSENIHQVVNENWDEVFADVKSSYEEVFRKLMRAIFNALLAKVPVNEIFGEE